MKFLPLFPRAVFFFLGDTERPYFLSIDATMRCNCRCDFCNIWKTPSNGDDIKIEREAENILLHRLSEAWDLGCRFVCLGGGEPLLYNNLSNLIITASNLGYYTQIITNGIALTDPAPWMKRLDVMAISFTMGRDVYEKSRQMRVFDLVKGNIERAVEYGLKLVLFDTVCLDTLPYVDETAEFAKSLGIKLHIFSVTEQPRLNYVHVDWRSKRPENVFLEMKRLKRKFDNTIVLWEDGEAMLNGKQDDKFRCRVADTTVTIKPDGSIALPCPAFPEYRSKPTEPLMDFWYSTRIREVRAKCGDFKFCEGCLHQYCNYHVSLAGKPLKALRWLSQSGVHV